MEHEVIIWSKFKEITNGKTGVLIENHIKINEEDILELALKKYENYKDLDKKRQYWAELDKTTIQ